MMDTKLRRRDTIFASEDGKDSRQVSVAFPSARLTPVVSLQRVVEATTYRALLTEVLLVSRTCFCTLLSGLIFLILPYPTIFPLAYLLPGIFVELQVFSGSPGHIFWIIDNRLTCTFGFTEIDCLSSGVMCEVVNLVVRFAHYPFSGPDIFRVYCLLWGLHLPILLDNTAWTLLFHCLMERINFLILNGKILLVAVWIPGLPIANTS